MKFFNYVVLAAIVMALAVAFAGCRKKVDEPATAETVETAATAEEPETLLTLSAEAQKLPPGTPVAVIEAEEGIIEIELLTKETPKTAGNFIKLVEDRFYDGIPFHRVERDFVAQAGDATLVGRENPAIEIPVEPDKRKTVRGAVSMARSMAPGATEYGATSPTQFFILTGDSLHLDPCAAVAHPRVTHDGRRPQMVVARVGADRKLRHAHKRHLDAGEETPAERAGCLGVVQKDQVRP